MNSIITLAREFIREGRINSIRDWGNGNVNDTFLVVCEGNGENTFILQRINSLVFPRPELVVRNMRTVTEHIVKRLETDASMVYGHRWETPRVLLTKNDRDHLLDDEGHVWRAMTFIREADTFDTLQGPDHAQEVGKAVGAFHSLIDDLPAGRLATTLEGFHCTPLYLRRHDENLCRSVLPNSSEVKEALHHVNRGRGRVVIIEDARTAGRIKVRPIHGDPKINNILVDSRSGKAVAVVDLDTVNPGLLLHDLGDCLRSCCNSLGEETEFLERVNFDMDLCRIILKAYVSGGRGRLSDADRSLLYEAVWLIAFELGLRFFTDYLEGNRYFKVRYKEQNLLRALVQFRLAESIERQEKALRTMIRGVQ